MKLRQLVGAATLVLALAGCCAGGTVQHGQTTDGTRQTLWMDNGQVRCTIQLDSGKLDADRLESSGGRPARRIETGADFALEVMWTDWQAPGKINNAENPVLLTKSDFRLQSAEPAQLPSGAAEWRLHFKGKDISLEVLVTYRLDGDAFYIHKKLAVRDSKAGGHCLRYLWPVYTALSGEVTVVKSGGFGQPLALTVDGSDAFFGLEYPAADNIITHPIRGRTAIRCGQEIGERISPDWLEGEWAVLALTPDANVKYWFFQYLDGIRVAPLRPFALYNSWYDLRAPEMVKDPTHVLNETNVRRIIDLFNRNMTAKYGLTLDAFVLDDGWDVYRSDWQLRSAEFPHGLKPIADELAKTKTALGVWFGPIGGYSHRDWRIGWMKEHGYEVVGDQLCLAGRNYFNLFKKRVVDFAERDGVGYYKWDGIQFSCSDPSHGHAVDIYSRRAVMEAVIELCRAVRAKNPAMFLNITSGTWLSPWWVKYADQIWIQGEDYGYADVPAITQRDAAITYRDSVLYEDFTKYNFWFPIANLMTHGIIKGNLQKLGGEDDPLDKFTDDVLLYFARGVSMHEFYISPDLLTDGEWQAIGGATRWARDRFPVLAHTEMIGGNPAERQAYGYLHFKGNHGVIALRNPAIEPASLRVELRPEFGLDPAAASLVVERLYPTRWISPRLYSTGGGLDLPLDGYETAVYEVYPLAEATAPLLAGVTFETVDQRRLSATAGSANSGKSRGNRFELTVLSSDDEIRLLNAEKVKSISVAGKEVTAGSLKFQAVPPPNPLADTTIQAKTAGPGTEIDITFSLRVPLIEGTVAVLLTPATASVGEELPTVEAVMDGTAVKAQTEKQKGQWAWLKIPVSAGQHRLLLHLTTPALKGGWSGQAAAWLIGRQKQGGQSVSFEMVNPTEGRPLPPLPWPSGEVRRNFKIGATPVVTPPLGE